MLGQYIKDRRQAAGLTLSSVAKAIGVSTPYLFDVEHDRRSLAQVRWGRLARAIPGLSLDVMVRARVNAGPVEVDARILSIDEREALVSALVRAAEAA
jgi:transcriptional regulator with XRE-family HTH domain